MGITEIIGIGIIGTILSVLLRGYRHELSICTALATGVVILSLCLPHLNRIITDIQDLCQEASINTEYFNAVLKIIAIAYLTQFAASIATDAGESAIAKKMELAGKVSVLLITLPIIKGLMSVILKTLSAI